MCSGNTDESENVTCTGIRRQISDSINTQRNVDGSYCCHITGMCTGNTDTTTEPDVDHVQHHLF